MTYRDAPTQVLVLMIAKYELELAVDSMLNKAPVPGIVRWTRIGSSFFFQIDPAATSMRAIALLVNTLREGIIGTPDFYIFQCDVGEGFAAMKSNQRDLISKMRKGER